MMSLNEKRMEVRRMFREIWRVYAVGADNINADPIRDSSDEQIDDLIHRVRAVANFAKIADPATYAATSHESVLFLANAMVNAGYRLVKT